MSLSTANIVLTYSDIDEHIVRLKVTWSDSEKQNGQLVHTPVDKDGNSILPSLDSITIQGTKTGPALDIYIDDEYTHIRVSDITKRQTLRIDDETLIYKSTGYKIPIDATTIRFALLPN
jgi:hypothetical protein